MSITFKIEESNVIKGVWIIVPSISIDNRGAIWTSYISTALKKFIPVGLSFKHDKFSKSKKNVLRGIHGDEKTWKLVTCVFGEIEQVVVDMRKQSDTYLKWQKFLINENNQCLILLPPNIGNAFYVKTDQAVYHYKLAYKGDYFDEKRQFSVKWNDRRIGIKWPISNPILSERDK